MEEAAVAREEKGPVSVLTMQYRPYNLLGPTLLGAIAEEIAAARDAGSRAIILRSGLRHFSAGADVVQFTAHIEQGVRSQSAIGGGSAPTRTRSHYAPPESIRASAASAR